MKTILRSVSPPAFGSLLLLLGALVVIHFGAFKLRAQTADPSKAQSASTQQTAPQPQTDGERFVLDQLQRGEEPDLEKQFPPDKYPKEVRELRGEFLKTLFTNKDERLKFPRGIHIYRAIIVGELDLRRAE